MATQIERTKAKLEKLQHEQDIKRLKMARGYLESGLTALKDAFNDDDIQLYASEAYKSIVDIVDGLKSRINPA